MQGKEEDFSLGMCGCMSNIEEAMCATLVFCRDSLSDDTLLSSLVIDLSRRSNRPGAFFSQKSLMTAGS
ncbi:hypothetical protein ACROYT_G029887 [Oculina patagonica]